MTDRRIFVRAVTAAAIAAPFSAVAQAPVTLRRIGILSTDAPYPQASMDQALLPLRKLGWVEGRNLGIELRYLGGDVEHLRTSVEELVRLGVEIIGTQGTSAALAAKAATKTIPIVLWSAGDPVGSGLVASLSRPGGNVTGFSFLTPEIEAKRVELLRDLVPGLLRLAVLDPVNHPFYRARRTAFQQATGALGVQPFFFEVATQGQVDSAIMEASRRGAQGLLVPQEPLFQDPRPVVATAAEYGLPIVSASASVVAAGGLAALTHSVQEKDERFAWFVDKILRSARPGELPIQQPTKFAIVVNKRAAKTLGLTIPRAVLLRADEIIE